MLASSGANSEIFVWCEINLITCWKEHNTFAHFRRKNIAKSSENGNIVQLLICVLFSCCIFISMVKINIFWNFFFSLSNIKFKQCWDFPKFHLFLDFRALCIVVVNCANQMLDNLQIHITWTMLVYGSQLNKKTSFLIILLFSNTM